jgi:hypothetical protein
MGRVRSNPTLSASKCQSTHNVNTRVPAEQHHPDTFDHVANAFGQRSGRELGIGEKFPR